MKNLVIFNSATGKIFEYVQCVDIDAGLYPPDPASQTALEIPLDHQAITNQNQWRIVNGALQQKNIVQASASSATFPADGQSQIQITFAGLNGSTNLTVAGQQVTVTPADNVLTLTADAPQSFKLQVNDGDQWSDEIQVEAL